LVGTSAAYKESALRDELRSRGIDLSKKPSSEGEAAAFIAKVATLDVQTVPIAIALNRWTEDSFHGDVHRSTAEWIPEIPFEASGQNLEKWIGLQNAYLEDTSDDRLWAMIDGISLLDAKRFTEGGASERLAREKYKSVLLFQHQMRRNDRRLPDLTRTSDVNRFSVWEAALIAGVMGRGCADLGTEENPFPCWKYPASFFKKMGSERTRLLSDALSLSLPWLVAGLYQDPALQFTEGGGGQMSHVHAASERRASAGGEADALPFHNLYFSLVRLVKSVEAVDERLPSGEHLDHKAVRSCWAQVGPGLAQWLDDTLPALDRMLKSAPGESEQRQLVNEAVSAAHFAVLWMIKKRLAAPLEGCKASGHEPMTLQDAVPKIVAWHEAQNLHLDEVKALAAGLAE
jgi:hypothetical protein